MSRYRVTERPWFTEQTFTGRFEGFMACVELQVSDIVDTRNGTVYADGAYRVIVNGKAHRGKGGTVPFYGESAWSDGERLYGDTLADLRWARGEYAWLGQ